MEHVCKKLCCVGSANHGLIMGVERDNTFTDNPDISEQSQNHGKIISENNENRKVVTAKTKLYKSPKKRVNLYVQQQVSMSMLIEV